MVIIREFLQKLFTTSKFATKVAHEAVMMYISAEYPTFFSDPIETTQT